LRAYIFVPHTVAIVTAIAALTGCGLSQTPMNESQMSTQADVSITQGPVSSITNAGSRRDRAHSWMAPNAKNEALLYVPDTLTGDVDIYTYPSGKLAGKLTGFNGPQDACVDKAQDIWITAEFASKIIEYAHGGTTPLTTLTDPRYLPIDCSVDPTTGNLAVTNYQSIGSPYGGTVAIYTNASGEATLYSDGRQIYNMYYCAYDGSGNLWVDGTQYPDKWPSGEFQYAELAKGSGSFANLTLTPPQTIAWPGGIQWDGTYVEVANLLQSAIYRTSGATVKSTIRARGARGAVDFFIDAKTLLIGTDSGQGQLGLWTYPAGGPAQTMLKLEGRRDPVATAVVSN
jgi:hypothetical protein